jgi:hypothetical protein
METKKSWNDIPSLEGLAMDWEYKSERAQDKRVFVRLGKESLAKLFEAKEVFVRIVVDGQAYTARLLDLSEGGLAVDAPVSLEASRSIKLGFLLGKVQIVSKAEVRHVRKWKDRYITGVKFINLDKESAEFIRGLYASKVLLHAP